MAQIYAAVPAAAKAEAEAETAIATSNRRASTAMSDAASSTSNKHEGAAVEFAYKRDALLSSIENTTAFVSSLSGFNDSKWSMHYPSTKLGFVDTREGSKSTTAAAIHAPGVRDLRRSASLFGDEAAAGPASAPTTPMRPKQHQRAFSTMTPTHSAHVSSSSSGPATASTSHPLAIDLRLGAPGQTATANLMESMSQATIAGLLSKRFEHASSQLSSLQARVKDNQSRILVTGDVNAGKSTFVNALLRRDILPTDQQPLTTVFCEVLDAQAHNEGKEEVHAILAKKLSKYERTSSETFERFGLDKLEEIATDEEQRFGIVKVYLEDSRAPISSTVEAVVEHAIPAEQEAKTNKSFIRNGIVSISLIDGPGLNIDSLKTTAVFARQSEIDVVVFVATATEYLTESGKNFLFTAGMEKAYIFIVVNKFETLRNKEKARKNILEQIKKVSPKTWENREELVHFVEAANVIDEIAKATVGEETAEDTAFVHLEESLRSFLLLKRSISKLTPAKHYLLNLLSDLSIVAEENLIHAAREFDEAEIRLAQVKPLHEKLVKERELVEEAVGKEEEETFDHVRSSAKQLLQNAVEQVASIGSKVQTPEYPGVLGLWDWMGEIKASLVEHVECEIWAAEEEAKQQTIKGVETVTGDLAKQFLPAAAPSSAGPSASAGTATSGAGAASALPQRIFNHKAMFSKRRQALEKRKRSQHSASALTEAERQLVKFSAATSEIELSFLDLLDVDRLLRLGRSSLLMSPKSTLAGDIGSKALVEAGSALSMASLGVGAITMFGTRVVGVKSVIEAITSLCELLGSRAARKWAGPIAGVMTLALGAYIIHDLPRAIPANIGRKLHAQLVSAEFSAVESERIAGETRKVMRMAGWDLRERFRAALEASEKDRRAVEGKMDKADKAMAFLEEYLDKIASENSRVELVEL